jgi:2-iminobutanoate/2-iminopropanoate deaminase
MERTVIATKNAPGAIGPYNQAIKISAGLIYTSGQIPLVAATGEMAPADIALQTSQVCENLKAILQAAGSDLAHVIKTTVYLKDMGDFAAMNTVYATYFKDPAPARTTVEVSKLPKDARIEIEAIAIVAG